MLLAIRCRARSCFRMPLTETASRSFLVLTSSTAAALVTGISMVANTAVATRAALLRTSASWERKFATPSGLRQKMPLGTLPQV